MNPLTQARADLAAMLAPLGVKTYPVPVEAPSYPCLEIVPSTDQWIERQVGKGSATLRLVVRVAVQSSGGNVPTTERLEDLVWGVMQLLPIAGADAPQSDTSGSSAVIYTDLTTIVRVSE
jgi:hypothetical protein